MSPYDSPDSAVRNMNRTRNAVRLFNTMKSTAAFGFYATDSDNPSIHNEQGLDLNRIALEMFPIALMIRS